MLVEKLLEGQRKLDQMKQEVNAIVRAAISSLDKSNTTMRSFDFEHADHGAWKVVPIIGNGTLIVYSSSKGGEPYFRAYDGKIEHGSPECVIATRAALETLVEGIFNEFPGIRERAQPFLDLAE
jgi:hypothetical protein